jgi:hypothetical protein
MDRFSSFVSRLWSALLSIAKAIVFSRWRTGDIPRIERLGDELVILGNGPSLGNFLEEKSAFLEGKESMCVNYAVESVAFATIRPRYYIAVDPVIYTPEGVERLFAALARKTAWELHLFVPDRFRKAAGWRRAVEGNPYIKIHRVNTTPIEGTDALCFPLYRSRLGMPRPRNVLIPALMCGLWMGYRTIWTVGVEHTWHLLLRVDDRNELMIDDRHFYDPNDRETVRRHGKFRMDTIFRSLYIVFAGYHTIERFSRRLGAAIYNITPGSYIDAFERRSV